MPSASRKALGGRPLCFAAACTFCPCSSVGAGTPLPPPSLTQASWGCAGVLKKKYEAFGTWHSMANHHNQCNTIQATGKKSSTRVQTKCTPNSNDPHPRVCGVSGEPNQRSTQASFFKTRGGGVRPGPTQGGGSGVSPPGGGVKGTQKIGVKNTFYPKKKTQILCGPAGTSQF